MQLGKVGNVALNALAYPMTTSVAEGTFCAMKGLLMCDRCFMSHDRQIGYLLAMVNGDVNMRIPSWALSLQSSLIFPCFRGICVCICVPLPS